MAKEQIFPGVTKLVLHNDDDSWVAEDASISIWGAKADFSVSLTPKPFDSTDAMLEEALARCVKEAHRALLRECADLLPVLRAQIPPRMPDLDRKIAELYDAESFKTNNREIQAIFRRDTQSATERALAILPFLRANLDILKALSLPEELRRDDGSFLFALGLLNAQTHGLLEKVEAEHPGPDSDLTREFTRAAREYVTELERLIDEIQDGAARLKGLERAMTPEEEFAVSDQEDVVNDEDKPLQRRLATAQKLWRNPLLGQGDRVEIMETAVQLIFERLPKSSAWQYPAPLEPCIAAAREYLSSLAAQERAEFVAPLAAHFLEGANEWRESSDMPELTAEAFAATIRLSSIHIDARETDGGVDVSLECYFTDSEDSFAGHWMNLRKDENGEEYNLMG